MCCLCLSITAYHGLHTHNNILHSRRYISRRMFTKQQYNRRAHAQCSHTKNVNISRSLSNCSVIILRHRENVLNDEQRKDNKKEVNGGVIQQHTKKTVLRDDHKKEVNKLEKRHTHRVRERESISSVKRIEKSDKSCRKEAMKMCKSSHYLNDSKRKTKINNIVENDNRTMCRLEFAHSFRRISSSLSIAPHPAESQFSQQAQSSLICVHLQSI